jgi:hypothetical protein
MSIKPLSLNAHRSISENLDPDFNVNEESDRYCAKYTSTLAELFAESGNAITKICIFVLATSTFLNVFWTTNDGREHSSRCFIACKSRFPHP